jgi:hypothetical protein
VVKKYRKLEDVNTVGKILLLIDVLKIILTAILNSVHSAIRKYRKKL